MFIIKSGYPCNLIKYQMHIFKAPLEEYKGREGAYTNKSAKSAVIAAVLLRPCYTITL